MAQKNFGGQQKFSFPPWLTVAASMVLMIMVALVAASNAKSLKDATQWRRHSTEVILAGQAFENNLLNVQREMRSYVFSGDTNALSWFYSDATLESRQFKNLATLTLDSPSQQKRLRILAADINKLLVFDYQEIDIRRHPGMAGSKTEAVSQRKSLFGPVQEMIAQFLAQEQSLWDMRDASEQEQYHYAGRLLVIGSVIAALLLLVATYQANRELAFRRQAEAKLKEALLVQNAILGSADYGIVATDRKGTVQTFNPAAERLLGYSAPEVIGKATPMLWRDPLEVAERAELLSKKMGVPVRPTYEVVIKKIQSDMIDEGEWTFVRKDGSRFPSFLVVTPLADEAGNTVGYVGVFRDINEQKKSELEREELIAELKKTLAHVKTLSGLIPICAWCKSVRSDTGYWQTVEQYVRTHSEASFSHGMCPSCAEKFKNDIRRGGGSSNETLLSKT
jgi:PAS domain S-box-containing protein